MTVLSAPRRRVWDHWLAIAVVSVCAGLAIAATTQPWLAGYAWSERGLDLWQGKACFAAGVCTAWCCAYRLSGPHARWFAPVVSALGLVMAAMTLTVLMTGTGLRDDRSVADGLHAVMPRFGLFMALAAGCGCAVLPWSLRRRGDEARDA